MAYAKLCMNYEVAILNGFSLDAGKYDNEILKNHLKEYFFNWLQKVGINLMVMKHWMDMVMMLILLYMNSRIGRRDKLKVIELVINYIHGKVVNGEVEF